MAKELLYLSEASRERVRAKRVLGEEWGLPEELIVIWIRGFEGYALMDVIPYPAFSELTPADPLGKETAQFLANKELYPINWVFQTFPSQEFKNQLGSHLAQYASGKEDWSAVKEYFVSTWKSEKSA